MIELCNKIAKILESTSTSSGALETASLIRFAAWRQVYREDHSLKKVSTANLVD